jgi:hypothetical protein
MVTIGCFRKMTLVKLFIFFFFEFLVKQLSLDDRLESSQKGQVGYRNPSSISAFHGSNLTPSRNAPQAFS